MAVGDWVLTVESIREFDDVAERAGGLKYPVIFLCPHYLRLKNHRSVENQTLLSLVYGSVL